MNRFKTTAPLLLALLCIGAALSNAQFTACNLAAFEISYGRDLKATFNVNSLDALLYNASLIGTPFNASTNYTYLPTFNAFNAILGRQANFSIRLSTDPSTFNRSSGNSANVQNLTINGLDARCSNVLVFRIESYTPLPFNSFEFCSYSYILSVHSTQPSCVSAAIDGDPQFRGLRGQSYQVHGIDGAVYSIISGETYAVNSRFKFLRGPRTCPILPSSGRKSTGCWSHDGSYLQNLAAFTSSSERILVESGTHLEGFSLVSFNGNKLSVGDRQEFSEGFVSYNTTHEVTVQIGAFSINVENNNEFLNLAKVTVVQPVSELARGRGVHGLLGQTWQAKRYHGKKVPEIEGEIDDYVIAEDDEFGTDFVFNRFQPLQQAL